MLLYIQDCPDRAAAVQALLSRTARRAAHVQTKCATWCRERMCSGRGQICTVWLLSGRHGKSRRRAGSTPSWLTSRWPAARPLDAKASRVVRDGDVAGTQREHGPATARLGAYRSSYRGRLR